jgi:hypothetical protein
VKLSRNERAVLEIIVRKPGRTPTGIYLARTMVNDYGIDTVPAGVHRTAASLVRKGLLVRTGLRGRRTYEATKAGKAELS